MKTILATLFLSVAFSATVAAQPSYGSERIKAACAKVGIGNMISDAILNADTVLVANEKNISLRISNGRVDHVGYTLFTKEQRSLVPSPVYDYLEFACLDIKLGVSENPFVYENLRIKGGTLDEIIRVARGCRCSVTRMDNVAYSLEWEKKDGGVITASFPIGYEKLYMMSRTEIEKRFISELGSEKAISQADIAEPDSTQFVKGDNGILTLSGEHYLITDVNQNLYYMKNDVGSIVLIWDKQYPAESVANMFISHDKWLTGYPITLRIPTHERKTEEVKVTVRQLLAYAQQTGCKAYWGLESLTESEMKGTLFFYNPAYGYDHVLNISCDPRQIGANGFELTALVSLFSPTTNIHNLFAKSKGKSTPKKIE